MDTCPEYRIYFAAQKVLQLYRQLPEACVVIQKSSRSKSQHSSVDFHRPHPGDDEELKHCFSPTHIGLDSSTNCHGESVFEKNEMFQLRRVLRCLRRSGRLCAIAGRCAAVPGQFYSFCASFTAEQSSQQQSGVLLRSVDLSCGQELRLFCEEDCFYGADCYAASLFAWEDGGALPLAGVMLCLTSNGCFTAGLPLFLAIRNNP